MPRNSLPVESRAFSPYLLGLNRPNSMPRKGLTPLCHLIRLGWFLGFELRLRRARATTPILRRFSGGTTGLCVGHVAPEAADGGPLAFVQDGDRIRINIPERTLDLLVDEAELAQRRKDWQPLSPRYTRGVLNKYARLVGSASRGAVCD